MTEIKCKECERVEMEISEYKKKYQDDSALYEKVYFYQCATCGRTHKSERRD